MLNSKPLAASPMKEEKKKTPDKWEIESAHRTLMDAHKVMGDPNMMKHVSKHHKKEKKKMRSIDDLIQRKHELVNGEDEPMNDEAEEC